MIKGSSLGSAYIPPPYFGYTPSSLDKISNETLPCKLFSMYQSYFDFVLHEYPWTSIQLAHTAHTVPCTIVT